MTTEKTKICTFPFSRYESGEKRTFVPCCSAWLTDEYYALDGGGEYWNGPAAQELRRRVLAGDYSFCKRDQCQIPLKTLDEIVADPKGDTGTPISDWNLEVMKRGNVYMPEGPTTLELSLDVRCNLACPTCRTERYLTLPYWKAEGAVNELKLLWKSRSTIQVVKMSGNSEVFFSADQRKMLQNMSRENFPKLDYIHVITNGLLMDQKTMDALRPGTDFIEIVSLSIDAASEAVYAVTRGGDWNRLLRNLAFIKSLRTSGKLRYFEFLFVVRAANFRDMEKMVSMAYEYGADRVRFIQFNVWEMMSIPDYEAEAVHLKGNPHHQEFRDICAKLRDDPKVLLAIDQST